MPENTDNVQTNMTIGDFVMLRNIIDGAAQRGTFKGNELSDVGQVRDKLNALIVNAQAVMRASAGITDSEGEEDGNIAFETDDEDLEDVLEDDLDDLEEVDELYAESHEDETAESARRGNGSA